MSRRYQELEEKARRDVDGAKTSLKRLGDPERAFVIRWLLKYFDDDGRMRSPQAGKPRRCIPIDGVEYWLVAAPKRRL